MKNKSPVRHSSRLSGGNSETLGIIISEGKQKVMVQKNTNKRKVGKEIKKVRFENEPNAVKQTTKVIVLTVLFMRSVIIGNKIFCRPE